MSRLGPALGGVAGGGLFCAVIVGSPVAAVTFAAVAVLAAVLHPSRRGGSPERAWSARREPGPHAPAPAPVAPGAATTARVARSLGRIEARELVLSTTFGVGLAFCAAILLVFGGIWGGQNGTPWAETTQLAPWFAHPLVGLTVLALHRAATRPARDRTDELFDTCPAGPLPRTLALLSTAWVPMAALGVFYVAYGVTVAVRSPNIYGPIGADAAADVLGGLALGAGGVALGVALGRWVAFALAPVVAVVAVCFASLGLATAGDPGWNPLAALSTFPPLSDPAAVFTDRPVWWHVVWIAALTVAVGVLAVARTTRTRAVATTGVVAMVVALVAGVAATRPLPDRSAGRIAGLVASPATSQTCLAAATVDVCTFAGHGELARRVVREVAPVAAALPPAAAPLTLRHLFDGTLDDLPPEVARRLPHGIPPLAEGSARLTYEASPDQLRTTRLLVALGALGAPVEPGPGGRPELLAGQARGVVALWLATRALDADDARRMATFRGLDPDSQASPDAFDLGDAWPADCSIPVVWSRQDLEAARAVLGVPEARVEAVVTSGWERWADPRTPTAELLTALGLPGFGAPDAVVVRPVGAC